MKIRRAIEVIRERIEINKEIMEEHDFGASIREEIEALEAAIEALEKLEEAEE